MLTNIVYNEFHLCATHLSVTNNLKYFLIVHMSYQQLVFFVSGCIVFPIFSRDFSRKLSFRIQVRKWLTTADLIESDPISIAMLFFSKEKFEKDHEAVRNCRIISRKNNNKHSNKITVPSMESLEVYRHGGWPGAWNPVRMQHMYLYDICCVDIWIYVRSLRKVQPNDTDFMSKNKYHVVADVHLDYCKY